MIDWNAELLYPKQFSRDELTEGIQEMKYSSNAFCLECYGPNDDEE